MSYILQPTIQSVVDDHVEGYQIWTFIVKVPEGCQVAFDIKIRDLCAGRYEMGRISWTRLVMLEVWDAQDAMAIKLSFDMEKLHV